jgi:heme o synthase
LMFGLVMAALACILMALAGGVLASGLLAFTIAFYAVVYTMWLKRRTPYNVVIGGLAGALPPAVAWAAKAGDVSVDALVLVLIIFLWTPPHSWALALFRRDDYITAQVPMLPVAKGVAATKLQIVVYSALLAPATFLLVMTGFAGLLYAAVALFGGACFFMQSIRLAAAAPMRVNDRAKSLFLLSLIYLFALFAAVLIEALFGEVAL